MAEGARAVVCKASGYSGSVAGATAASAVCDRGRGVSFCGGVAPRISNLACTGHESGLVHCPYAEGGDVYCAVEAMRCVAASAQPTDVRKWCTLATSAG